MAPAHILCDCTRCHISLAFKISTVTALLLLLEEKEEKPQPGDRRVAEEAVLTWYKLSLRRTLRSQDALCELRSHRLGGRGRERK